MCLGYFDGLMDGMDNTGGWQLEDGTTAVLQIKRSAISSTWDVIRAFYGYVDANPLANGKPAWSVLQSFLRTNGLARQKTSPPRFSLHNGDLFREHRLDSRKELFSEREEYAISVPIAGFVIADQLIGRS